MKITTSGFPKHGCHALVKAVQLLGVNCAVDHIAYAQGVPDGMPHVFIKRDPRDALVSWLRFNGQPVTQGMMIAAMSDMRGTRYDSFAGKSLVDAMAAFEGWLTDPATLVVRFGDLIASDACMRQIADYIGVPYLDDAFQALPGGTVTWTGQLSDYRTVWTDAVQAAWADAGGQALLARWGY